MCAFVCARVCVYLVLGCCCLYDTAALPAVASTTPPPATSPSAPHLSLTARQMVEEFERFKQGIKAELHDNTGGWMHGWMDGWQCW